MITENNEVVFNNIVEMGSAEPSALTEYLIKRHTNMIPEGITEAEEIDQIISLLGKLTNEKTFLMSLYAYLQYCVRNEKIIREENRANKTENETAKRRYEEAMCRREIVGTIIDNVKSQYDAVSRMLAGRKEKYDELRGLGEYPALNQPPLNTK